LLARGEFTVLNFSCAVDGAVRVKVDHQYRFLTPISGLLDLTTGSAPSVGITMTAESQWRREVAC